MSLCHIIYRNSALLNHHHVYQNRLNSVLEVADSNNFEAPYAINKCVSQLFMKGVFLIPAADVGIEPGQL